MVKILVTQTFWIEDDKLEMINEDGEVKKFSEINYNPEIWEIHTIGNIERNCDRALVNNCIVRKIEEGD